jgi:hypothetical protein
MKRPAFQFYPADWRKDPELRVCSIAARGLWIDMLAIMHEGTPYGHLTTSGGDISPADLARLVGEPAALVRRLLGELEARKVFSRDSAGVIHSRRMVRDEHIRNVRAAAGALGGNPHLLGAKDKQTDNQTAKQNPTPSSAVAVSSSSAPSELTTTTPTTTSARAVARRKKGSADTSWLTPFCNAHEKIFGAGSFKPLAGRFAASWRRLVEIHGAEKCADHWRFSQGSPESKQHRFNTVEYVASHFAEFDPKAPAFPNDPDFMRDWKAADEAKEAGAFHGVVARAA